MSNGRSSHKRIGEGLRRENLVWKAECGRESNHRHAVPDNEHPHTTGLQKWEARRSDYRSNAKADIGTENNTLLLVLLKERVIGKRELLMMFREESILARAKQINCST